MRLRLTVYEWFRRLDKDGDLECLVPGNHSPVSTYNEYCGYSDRMTEQVRVWS